MVTLLAIAVALPAAARADEEWEPYELVQPRMPSIEAKAHPELPWHPTWQRLHDVTLEFTAMLAGFHGGDRQLVLKLRNLEPVYFATEMLRPRMRRLSVVGVNISHSGTLNDPNLAAYLHHRGISDEAVHAGRRFVFADGSIYGFTTSNAFKAAAFPQTNAAHDPAVVHAIAGPPGQPERYSWLSLRAFVGDGGLDAADDGTKQQRVHDAYLNVVGHWEFSTTLPHLMGNSSRYEQQADGSWTAMARRDRQVWSADGWQHSSPTVEVERERAVRYMEDLKAFFSDGANQTRFRSRIALWRHLRRAADRGRWDRIAAIVEDEHAKDPGFGEALARDVVGALHFGRPHQHPGFGHEEILRVRGAAPVAPWLVQKLRSLPRTR